MRRAVLAVVLAGCGAPSYRVAVIDAEEPVYIATAAGLAEAALFSHGCGHASFVPWLSEDVYIANVSRSYEGRPTIFYNPPRARDLEDVYGPGATLWWVSHEYGHQIELSRARPSDPWVRELLADAWAGCAFGVLRLDPDEAYAMLSNVSREATATHPAAPDRISASEAGRGRCAP
jgi:hypothetical protein